jgi:nucleoside-diphosphate-sugar epimerase
LNCLVTGSTGFLGAHVVPSLEKHHTVKIVSLRNTAIQDIQFDDINTIIHLAGLAHQMTAIDPQLYFDVNKKQTLALAEKAKDNGVKHFIFISTVKVYGDTIKEGINEDSKCNPTDPYGQSKWEAEVGLKKLEDDKFSVAIIRPTLIYGKGVKGNLDKIIKLCLKIPVLPFGAIDNNRSMVYAGNVAALIIKIIDKKSSGVFIAGDKQNPSTSELVNTIIKKIGLKTYNVKLPHFLRGVLKILKPNIYSRLFGDFIIDNALTNKKLDFTSPYSFEEGIENMVAPYIQQNKKV